MILTITNSEYHARPEVGNSGLKLFGKSPAHYKAGFSGINPSNARVGTSYHAIVLEGGKDCIAITESRGRSSGADREWWADYFKGEFGSEVDTKQKVDTWFPEIEKQTGKTIVSAEEKNAIDCMYQSFLSNQEAVDLLEDTEPELTVIQTINGVETKTRPDASNPKRIVDVKTCEDASPHGFARACATYGYHRQDAFYSMSHHAEYGEWPEFKFIAQEKKPPYSCVVYELCIAAKENGAWLVERDLARYRECLESNEWPSYPNNYDLSIPIYDRQPEFESVENLSELMA